MGRSLHLLGEYGRYLALLGEAEALARALDDRIRLGLVLTQMTWVLRQTGDPDSAMAEGRALLEEGIREGLGTGSLLNVAYRVAWLSEVCRLAGHREESWQHARQALDLARRLKARGGEALALHQLGVVQAHADPPDAVQAEARYQQALALAEALGMRPLVAHCHLGLGRLYGQIGRGEEARVTLSTAIDLYRAMDMTFWLPQAEAAPGQIRG